MKTHSVVENHTFTSGNFDGKVKIMKKRAIGYVRVSTDMQAQFGLSLDAQKDQITKYAQIFDIEVIGFYVDHDSAKSIAGRPEYQKMMAEIDKGKASYIIASGLDRFSRSQRDFLDFQDKYINTNRAHLILIRESINTEQPATRQFLGFLVVFAQMERERTSERVKGIIAYTRDKGGHYGKVPFGYMTIPHPTESRLKKLVPNPETYPWLEKMAELYHAKKTFSEIADYLNENGIKPAYSEKWTGTSVYDLLCKEKIHVIRSEMGTKVYDREKAHKIAYEMKSEDRTFSQIAERLNKEGLRPGKASEYKWWSVQDLLRSVVWHDRSTAKGCAKHWHQNGLSLRDIALKLMQDGHKTKRGSSQWYAQQVKDLLVA